MAERGPEPRMYVGHAQSGRWAAAQGKMNRTGPDACATSQFILLAGWRNVGRHLLSERVIVGGCTRHVVHAVSQHNSLCHPKTERVCGGDAVRHARHGRQPPASSGGPVRILFKHSKP